MSISPGPWKLNSSNRYDGRIEVRTADGGMVAIVDFPTDAVLIGACPDLLEALRDAEDKCRSALAVAESYLAADRMVDETNWRALRDRLRESVKAQRAVIAKATGGTP